ncbi:hypothetical protein GCM10010250_69590 [Streptomyces althioticus]|nr:hypothetical protein GCM10010250_69590 [Streptomyces althioticus]
MRYIKLGTTGLEVSALTLGCMSFGEPGRGGEPWSLDADSSRDIINVRRRRDARPGRVSIMRAICCMWASARAGVARTPMCGNGSLAPGAEC